MTDRYAQRPAPLTPFERMVWQQQNCTEDVTGYAVGLAVEETKRAAYLTEDCKMTTDERQAAVLPKDEAIELMHTMTDESSGFYMNHCYRMALLVPVSDNYPLDLCTFQGH